jgi:hypothetical protein
MRRYHHLGIPTEEVKAGETHLKHQKVFVVSHDKSEFGVEWMRFEADDLDAELAGREILIAPNSPSDGVRVAFIVENGGGRLSCWNLRTRTIRRGGGTGVEICGRPLIAMRPR